MSTGRCRRRYCKCGKLRLPDKSAAIQIKHHFLVTSEREVIPQRAYNCQVCRGWHLTSKTRTGADAVQQ